MLAATYGHTATLLADGKVLIDGAQEGGAGTIDRLSELYDPATGTFGEIGSYSYSRSGHTATRMADGRVLIAGGAGNLPYDVETDPSSGRVLMTGGDAGSYSPITMPLPDAEVYDPASGTFSPTPSMAVARTLHTATLLPNGRVLIVGGSDGDRALASAESYDPAAGTFASAGSMSRARYGATATLLADGRVLICGGSAGASAELYTP